MFTAHLLFGRDHRGLERVELLRPEPAKAFHPRSQLLDPSRVELVDPPLRIAPDRDKIGVAQHFQMLRDGGGTHLETAGNVAGPERTFGKDFHDLAACRIA
jgi:hypothetical protein